MATATLAAATLRLDACDECGLTLTYRGPADSPLLDTFQRTRAVLPSAPAAPSVWKVVASYAAGWAAFSFAVVTLRPMEGSTAPFLMSAAILLLAGMYATYFLFLGIGAGHLRARLTRFSGLIEVGPPLLAMLLTFAGICVARVMSS